MLNGKIQAKPQIELAFSPQVNWLGDPTATAGNVATTLTLNKKKKKPRKKKRQPSF